MYVRSSAELSTVWAFSRSRTSPRFRTAASAAPPLAPSGPTTPQPAAVAGQLHGRGQALIHILGEEAELGGHHPPGALQVGYGPFDEVDGDREADADAAVVGAADGRVHADDLAFDVA